jgi:hypothetical protein
MKTGAVVTLVILVLIVCGGVTRGRAAEGAAAYDAKVSFRPKQGLTFPDFTLVYKGEKNVKPPAGLRSWTVHEFTVTADEKEQAVSWSSGTGDIGPTPFSVGRKKFLLELSYSDTLGRLKTGELVVRRDGGKR